MDDAALAGLTLTNAAALIAKRELSPLDLTEACIARSERLNPQLNAYITTTFDTALAEAKQATADIARGAYRGPLHGIPFALKDLYETAGVRTTAGSKLLEHNVPTEDAFVVSKLKDAGAILLGKLNMHEWALGGTNVNEWYGAAHNPWNLDYITGGSSGGSGAATSAGLCFGSLGSDTRGSIRVPASFCGITGLKPTYGRVSLRGVIPLNWSMDHAGPMARSAADCALILQAIAGYDDLDPTCTNVAVPDFSDGIESGLRGIRIGVPNNFFFDEAVVEPEVTTAVNIAAVEFRRLGAIVSSVDFPDPSRFSDNGAFLVDSGAYHEANLLARPDNYSPAILSRLLATLDLKAVEYSRARYRQLELKRAMGRLLQEVDLLLTPTVPITPLLIDEAASALPTPGSTLGSSRTTLLVRNTGPFNLTGSPAISIPCGFSKDGLPIGLQLAGRDWEEALVLRAAHAYQQATDWHKRLPPL